MRTKAKRAEKTDKDETPEYEAEVASYPHGRVPREVRRRQVLALARELFVERGYEGTSMDELARRVGVSKPVIYSIARSKEELVREVMAAIDEELAARVASAVAAVDDGRQRLHEGILAFLRFVDERREDWGALLAADSGPPRAAYQAMQKRQVQLVAALVAAGTKAPNPQTAELIARMINGAVEYAALWWRDHPDVSAEALAELLDAAFSPNLFDLAARQLDAGSQRLRQAKKKRA